MRGTLAELIEHFTTQAPRGEITLVVGGAPPKQPEKPSEEQLLTELTALLGTGLGRKQAARQLSEKYGLPVKEIYALGLE